MTEQGRPDVVVVGGGIIGLSAAWRAAQAGATVTVVDPTPGAGASHVAAGMIAPVTELAYGEQELLRLTIASAGAWPGFAADLEAAAEQRIDFRAEGTLMVAFDGDDLAVLDRLVAYQRELGLTVERWRSRDCRRHEPLLHPRVRGGLLAGDDHRVDPRRVVAALRVAAERAGVTLDRGSVAGLDHDGTRVSGVTLADGRRLAAPQVVLAAGSWSPQLPGLPAAAVPPVRPVKGQVLRLRAHGRSAPRLAGAVRGLVHGRPVYLVPREDGRVVVGATMEERGFDTTVTAGATRELLDDAARVVPGIDELELEESIAGLRPATPDNRPLIGPGTLEGLVLATGHHRHGVLLTPATADAVAALVTGGRPDPVVAVADPRRELAVRAGPGPAATGAAPTEGRP